MSLRIGDWVRESCGGPIMKIIKFVNSFLAICQELKTGFVKCVAIALLVVAVGGAEITEGHGQEDLPSHPSVVLLNEVSPIVASGTTTTTPAPIPPRPTIVREDESWLLPIMNPG